MYAELETVFTKIKHNWPILTAFLNRVNELPPDSIALHSRYGAFNSDSLVNEFLESRRKLLEIRKRLSVSKEEADCNAIPSGQYGFMFFLKNCITASNKCADRFNQISELSTPFQTQDLFLVKQLLASETGISQQCEGILNQCLNMTQETKELLTNFTETSSKINSSPLLKLSNQAIGSLEYNLSKLEKQINELKRKTDSRFLKKEKLGRLKAELNMLEEEKQKLLSQKEKKMLLTSDLDSFTHNLLQAQRAFQSISQLLLQIQVIFSEIAFRAKNASSLADKSQLGSKEWLEQTLQITASKKQLQFISAEFGDLLDLLTV